MYLKGRCYRVLIEHVLLLKLFLVSLGERNDVGCPAVMISFDFLVQKDLYNISFLKLWCHVKASRKPECLLFDTDPLQIRQ